MKPEDRPRRACDVERFLAANGCRGVYVESDRGWIRFGGEPTADWRNHVVEVCFFNQLTCEQWLKAFRAMNDNPSNRRSVIHRPSILDLPVLG